MGIENDRKLIVNCLPLTEAERAQFTRAAKGMPQEFVGDPAQRGSMNWTAEIPDELKAYATAVIGNITPETCAQCPRLEWLQTWSAGIDKYQRPGVLHPGSMLTNATGAYGQSVSEHMFAMMWAIMKNLHIYAASNPNAMWQDAGRAISPNGKTALIIGTGDIGSHFARLCKNVGMATIGIRRNLAVEAPGIDHMVGFDSLDDVLQYADVIAMRHPKEGAPLRASLSARVPVINAGDGGHAHPSQTMIDLMTIRQRKGRLDHLTIGFCGDLKFGRTVHSLTAALSQFEGNRFVFISPEDLRLPQYVKNESLEPTHQIYKETADLEAELPHLDVLYMTRIQQERFFNEEDYLRLKGCYALDEKLLQLAPPTMPVLHPLPRIDEIKPDVDNDPRAMYFEQARGGVFVRMALILSLLGLAPGVLDHE